MGVEVGGYMYRKSTVYPVVWQHYMKLELCKVGERIIKAGSMGLYFEAYKELNSIGDFYLRVSPLI